jgi:hypothetical protein
MGIGSKGKVVRDPLLLPFIDFGVIDYIILSFSFIYLLEKLHVYGRHDHEGFSPSIVEKLAVFLLADPNL